METILDRAVQDIRHLSRDMHIPLGSQAKKLKEKFRSVGACPGYAAPPLPSLASPISRICDTTDHSYSYLLNPK
jgi:hypothetical protein